MSVNKSCQPVAVGFKHYHHDWSFWTDELVK
jgi:hypothetical protein